jgi:asparagine synthetase B (glutamine-hydrolysing)
LLGSAMRLPVVPQSKIQFTHQVTPMLNSLIMLSASWKRACARLVSIVGHTLASHSISKRSISFLTPLSSQGDRMAMTHSVEGRYPFLDYGVIELGASLPDASKCGFAMRSTCSSRRAEASCPSQSWTVQRVACRRFFNASSGSSILKAIAGVYSPQERVQRILSKAEYYP